MSVLEANVDPENCVGSDHLPIFYTLNFDVSRTESSRYNVKKMDLDRYLAVLTHTLGLQPLPTISTQKDLDAATELLCEALSAALDASTPKHRPSSLAKSWWSSLLSSLCRAVRRARRRFQSYLTPTTRTAWLDARRDFYRAIVQAKQAAWYTFVKDLERIEVFKALNRLKERRSAVFTPIHDVATGEVALSHFERGRVLGRAWFGESAVEMIADAPMTLKDPSPEVTPAMRVDQTGNGTRRKRGGAFSEACPRGLSPPRADRQDQLPAPVNTSEPLDFPNLALNDLAASIPITHEHPFIEVTDAEVDEIIRSAAPWKAPDSQGMQMGYIQFLSKAATIAIQWAKDDKARFEKTKTELLHISPGRRDLSAYCVEFDGKTISPSDSVKWVGVHIDSQLKGTKHIKARVASASRALNASLALTHASWGLKPLMFFPGWTTVSRPSSRCRLLH
ncbi:hypothetical protein DFH09DRAFT_1082871 [Mycena vulgaris]|nr:hypothetical protein DFH09DRAFT_1082871 [Mycena vulgaris]